MLSEFTLGQLYSMQSSNSVQNPTKQTFPQTTEENWCLVTYTVNSYVDNIHMYERNELVLFLRASTAYEIMLSAWDKTYVVLCTAVFLLLDNFR